MLEATHGKPLKKILKNVVDEMSGWLDGEELLRLLGVIVAVENLPAPKTGVFHCREILLREALELGSKPLNIFTDRLKGEVQPVLHGESLCTRDPEISKALFPLLFQRKGSPLNQLRIYSDILWAAGRLASDQYLAWADALLTFIPEIFEKQNKWPEAEHLFEVATKAHPTRARTWQMWAVMVGRQGRVGSLGEPYTARWLFNRAIQANPDHGPSWSAWARLEEKTGNIGKSSEIKGGARWLYKRATEAEPNNGPSWSAWARLEEKAGNIGEDTGIEGTARWLFKKAVRSGSRQRAQLACLGANGKAPGKYWPRRE